MKRLFCIAAILTASLAPAQSLIAIAGSKTVTTDTGITFTPAAGAVSNPTTVTFSGAIAGSIYCSTQDGSTPATNLIGTACNNGSLGATTSITTAVTVKVVSGKLGDMDSAVASAPYTISGGGPAILASAACFATGGVTTFTTPAVSTTGAKVVVVTVSMANPVYTTTIVDNLSSTTLSCPGCTAYGPQIAVGHELLPSTTGSATFTITASYGMYGAVCVLPISGLAGTYDGNETTNSSGTTTCQAGSITPGSGTHIAIAAYQSTNGSNASINSSYTTPVQLPQVGGVNVAGGGSSLVIGTATNPTWSGLGASSQCMIESYQ